MIRYAFLLAIIAVSIGYSAGCSDKNHQDNKDLEVGIPREVEKSNTSFDLRVVTADDFSISVPESLRETPVTEDESKFWKFSDECMSVNIESGPFAPVYYENSKGFVGYSVMRTKIDGELVRVVSFNYGRRASEFREPLKDNVMFVHFHRSDRVKLDLSVQVNYCSENYRQTAINIVESVRFK